MDLSEWPRGQENESVGTMIWKWSELKRLLKNTDDVAQSACIMFPVGEKVPGVEEPHVTVIYLGDVANLNKQDILDAMAEVDSSYDAMFFARTGEVEWFGPEKNIPVLRMEHSYLEKYRLLVESALNKRGIENGSEYKEYKPHMTITEAMALTGNYQQSYILTEPELWWGREHIKPSR